MLLAFRPLLYALSPRVAFKTQGIFLQIIPEHCLKIRACMGIVARQTENRLDPIRFFYPHSQIVRLIINSSPWIFNLNTYRVHLIEGLLVAFSKNSTWQERQKLFIPEIYLFLIYLLSPSALTIVGFLLISIFKFL